MSKYIIRYKMGEWNTWSYFVKISNHTTYSITDKNNKSIMKMTFKEAEKNVIKIKKIHTKNQIRTTEIEILNIETNEIMSNEPEIIITRFELMEL